MSADHNRKFVAIHPHRLPLLTRGLGRFQWWLWSFDSGLCDWLGNRVSDLRYWLWFVSGGWRA